MPYAFPGSVQNCCDDLIVVGGCLCEYLSGMEIVLCIDVLFAFSALTLLVVVRKSIRPVKNK